MRKTALAVTLILAAFPASAQMPALFGQQPIDSLTPAQIRHLQQQMTPRPAAKFMPRPKTATPRPAPAELLGPNPKVPGLAGARLGGGLGGYVVKDGNGNIQTFFSFQCQSGWNCPGQVLIDDTGAEKATPSNPLRVDPTGTTPQPVTQSGSWTLAGGAANGAVPVGNPVWIAGWDGTDVRALSTNNAGVLNTTVAQASAASLNATVVGTGTFAVQATLNSTPSLANGNGVVPTQGGSVLSATNGGFTNVLQGNAALSATNGLYANILQGNAALSSSNPIFAQLTTGSAVIGALVANQTVNVAQINGAATLAGSGASGSGAQRITVAQDSATVAGSAAGTAGSASAAVVTVQGIASMTPLTVSPSSSGSFGVGPTGSAVPSSAAYDGINVAGNLRGRTGVNPSGSVYAAQIDLASVNGVSLGSPSNYGTSPGAVSVPGVNAFVTNTVGISASALPLPSNAAQETGGNLAALAGAVSASVMQGNLKQVNGATTLAGAGTVGTGSQRVAVGQDASTIAGAAPGTAGSPSTNVLSMQGVSGGYTMAVTLTNSAGISVGSSNQSPMITQAAPTIQSEAAAKGIFGSGYDALGQTRTASMITDGKRYADIQGPNEANTPRTKSAVVVAVSPNPSLQCPYTVAINQTGSTRVAGNPSGKSLHVCSFGIITGSAQGVSLVEGTGSVCATAPTPLVGGTGGTMTFGSNGGVWGVSDRITIPMQVPGDDLCVEQSSSGNVSGLLTYGVF